MDEQLNSLISSVHSQLQSFDGKFAKASDVASMQKQLDALDARGADHLGAPFNHKSLAKHLEESDQFQRLVHDRRGVARLTLTGSDAAAAMQRKTTITSPIVGYQTTGVLQIDPNRPAIVAEARQGLTIRDVLPARPTTYQVVDFVKVVTPMSVASPVSEGSVKPENQVSFTSQSERVKTIATWIPCSKQVLDDMTELAGFLETSLTYYVGLAEEQQILAGDGVGENLHGILPQSTSFNSSLVSGSWTKMDIIGRAIQQLTVAKEVPPSFCVLHPQDWWTIRLIKDSLGRYIIGDPQSTARANLFDLQVVSTTSIAPNTFLVGSNDPSAIEIRDRTELMYEVSSEHADYWTRNLLAARAERRMCLVLKRPGAFVSGNLTSSPA